MADTSEVPDGWEWTPIDVVCTTCSTTNKVPEQPPEWLNQPEGVKWECTTCGAANVMGGTGDVELPIVAECGECHATYTNRDGSTLIEVADDGSWTCPNCNTANRTLALAEAATASSTEAQA